MVGNRKAAGLASAAVLACGLAACGSDSDSSAGGSGDGAALTIVGPSFDQSGPDNPLNRLGRAFEQANPEVTVRVVTTAYDQFDQTVRVQLNGTSAPDVIFNAVGYGQATSTLPLVDAGVLVDLSDEAWASDLPEQVLSTVGEDGRVYTLPSTFSMVGAIYDRAVFGPGRMALPESYDDVLALCRRAAQEGKIAFAMGGQEPYSFQQLGSTLVAATVFAESPDFDHERLADDVTFAGTPGWREGLDRAQEMIDEGCFGEAPAAVSRDAANRRLATGRAWMNIATLEAIPGIEALNPDGEYGIFAMPGGTPEQTRVPAGAIFGFSIPVRSDDQELARRFVAFAAQPEVARRLAQVLGSMPAISGAGAPQAPPAAAPMQPFLDDGRTVDFVDALWPNPEVSNEFRTGIQGMASDQTTPEQVLDRMDSVWTSE